MTAVNRLTLRSALQVRPVDAAWAFALRAGLAVAVPLIVLESAQRPGSAQRETPAQQAERVGDAVEVAHLEALRVAGAGDRHHRTDDRTGQDLGGEVARWQAGPLGGDLAPSTKASSTWPRATSRSGWTPRWRSPTSSSRWRRSRRGCDPAAARSGRRLVTRGVLAQRPGTDRYRAARVTLRRDRAPACHDHARGREPVS